MVGRVGQGWSYGDGGGGAKTEPDQIYRDNSMWQAEGDSDMDVLIKRIGAAVEWIHIDVTWMERAWRNMATST